MGRGLLIFYSHTISVERYGDLGLAASFLAWVQCFGVYALLVPDFSRPSCSAG